jgi:hypothetical protein
LAVDRGVARAAFHGGSCRGRGLTGTDATELARLLPQLADGLARVIPIGQRTRRQRGSPVRRVARFPGAARWRRPTLVVLDDLQWPTSRRCSCWSSSPSRYGPSVGDRRRVPTRRATDAARVLARIAARGESLPLPGCPRAGVRLVAAAVGGDAARGWAAQVHRRVLGTRSGRQLAELLADPAQSAVRTRLACTTS